MKFLQEFPYCTTEDVCIIPELGVLDSRSDAELKPMFYNAPMDTVASVELLQKMLDLGEFAVVDRKLHINDPTGYEHFIKTNINNPNLWLSVGLKEGPELLNRLSVILGEEEISNGINVLVDISHGHSKAALAFYEALRASFPGLRGLMSGSICTVGAAHDCLAAGCTHLRVGIGGGAMCTTRIKTGVGIPNLSAVYMIASVFPRVQIIADGGIKESGQVAKYLCAGATGVMVGTRFASTWESGGWIAAPPENPGYYDPTNQPPMDYYKAHRGQASREYQNDYGCARLSTEGASTAIKWEGETLENIIKEWRGNLQSTASFCGLTSVANMNPLTTRMARVTPSAYIEGTPHGTY